MAVLRATPPFDELTYYPSHRWIRGTRGPNTIVDSRRALLVWEVGKKVPIYAFPREDVAPASDDDARGFGDPELVGYVAIPWDALEHWYEEDEDGEALPWPRRRTSRLRLDRSSGAAWLGRRRGR